ncbi:MAG: DoxX protein [Planctomycetes bacterium]|nr:DoxX protein [Planctomycetota bacterium]MCB9905952.1 DoxX protein [Planctomycetota bacterium]
MFVAIVRSLLGVFLLALGVVGLMRIMDPPPDMPEAARKFLGALESTGYMMYMTSGVKVLCGALLLFKRWVPFALVLLAPLSVNIVLYHVFLDPSFAHSFMAYGVAAANLFLAAKHHEAYRPLFR